MSSFKISFFEHHEFDDVSIRLVQGTVGLYFIYLETLSIPYPFKSSRLIYIGMSESKQNSIGNRLRDHKKGQSGNFGITNYSAHHKVRFTYHSIETLKSLGSESILQLESFFLADFLMAHGAYPISNNQSGVSFPQTTLKPDDIKVEWAFFA